MDFRFSNDTIDLREGAAAFLMGETSSERLRGLAQGGDPLEFWQGLAEMGLLGAAVSETQGGLGLAADECLLLSEEVGRSGMPEPFSETSLVLLPLLEQLGEQTSDKIDGVLSSTLRGAVIHPLNPFANHFKDLDFALVFDDETVRLIEGEALSIEPRQSIDPGRKIGWIAPGEGALLASGEDAQSLSQDAIARGACAFSAELCGLSARMIALATDYAQTREQFGKPIGTFQAVKHLMANAQIKLEFARPVLYRAGGAISANSSHRDLAVSHAKIAAMDAAMLAAENAIQVFGGMGYTFEVDLHFFMKRAWAVCGLWGDRSFHMARIDRAVLGGESAIGPGETFY